MEEAQIPVTPLKYLNGEDTITLKISNGILVGVVTERGYGVRATNVVNTDGTNRVAQRLSGFAEDQMSVSTLAQALLLGGSQVK